MVTQNLQGRLQKQFHIITKNCPKTETKTVPIFNVPPLSYFLTSAWPHLTGISVNLVFCSNNRIVNKMKCYVSFHHLLFSDEIWLQAFAYKITAHNWLKNKN